MSKICSRDTKIRNAIDSHHLVLQDPLRWKIVHVNSIMVQNIDSQGIFMGPRAYRMRMAKIRLAQPT